MRAAYVDSSCLVAIVFGDEGYVDLSARIDTFDECVSAPLLEAELRSALVREEAAVDPALFDWMSWILPDRPLSAEIGRVLEVGYLRGADLWHLASALFLAPDPEELTFLTADRRQAEVAHALGFPA